MSSKFRTWNNKSVRGSSVFGTHNKRFVVFKLVGGYHYSLGPSHTFTDLEKQHQETDRIQKEKLRFDQERFRIENRLKQLEAKQDTSSVRVRSGVLGVFDLYFEVG